MSDDLNRRIDNWLGGKGQPQPHDVEHALLDWLNDTGLKFAGDWLDRPTDPAAESYANAVMSLCASLPVELIELLQPRRMATLAKLREQAQRFDFDHP